MEGEVEIYAVRDGFWSFYEGLSMLELSGIIKL